MKHIISLLVFVVFTLIIAFVPVKLGWFDARSLLDVAMGIVAMSGLLAILKLPWDLYFEVRNLRAEQQESIHKNIDIPDQDVEYTNKMEKRMLPMCIGLHVISAAIIGLVTYFSNGYIGYYFAFFFLLSTAFRPLLAFYTHQKSRLTALHRRSKIPREDAIDFANRIKSLEHIQKETHKKTETFTQTNQQALDKIHQELDKLYALIKNQNRQYTEKVDRVSDEFSRSIEKLTEDKELLRGIRAFVKLVKTTN